MINPPLDDDATVMEPLPLPSTKRMLSVDALRGFDMFWIMGADSFGPAAAAVASGPATRALARQLEHAAWIGFHFYDLIFPLFIFLSGVSLVLSLSGVTPRYGKDAAVLRVVKRMFWMYLLGVFYYGGFSTPLEGVRLLGVLQRIALCYGACGLGFIFLKPRTLAILGGIILLGYWALLALVPVPGQTGGISFDEGHNIVNWFDSRFLPFRKRDGDHDPEGILSTFPAMVSCLLGVFCGGILTDPRRNPTERVTRLAIAGGVLLVAGYLWSLPFPIIKKLWTSSFVLVAGGWSALLLAAFYWCIDIQGWRRWCQPFVWVGLNPISIYLVSHFVDFEQLASRFAGGNVQALLDRLVFPGMGGLVIAALGAGFAFALAGFLHRRKIYIRL
jgi:hypothetical protein